MLAKTNHSTDFTRKLARPIVLSRRPCSWLEALHDAASLIGHLEPFRPARLLWGRAAGLILLAAETDKRADIAEATRQLMVCVERESWWKPHR
jgi:hypothetical protein